MPAVAQGALDYLIGIVILVTVVIHMVVNHRPSPTLGRGLFRAEPDFDSALPS